MNHLDLKEQPIACANERSDEVVTTLKGPVLVAIDLSPDSEAALIWAGDYAARIGAPLEILHIVHDPADAPGTYKPDGDDRLEPMVDVAERKLAKLIQRIEHDNPGLRGLGDAKSHCVQGLPASKILEVARDRSAQLVVLGGHRRNGFDRLVHGSTAHKVTSRATLPVTIVKANGR